MGLQPRSHGVAASITWGCSLDHIRLQVLDHNLLKDTLRTAPLFRSFSVL
jgi:hypothetical protein